MREMAQSWIEANCDSSEVRSDFLAEVGRSIREQVGVSLILGQLLTRHQIAYRFDCFCGEIFISPIANRPPREARILTAIRGRFRQNHRSRPALPVHLLGVEAVGEPIFRTGLPLRVRLSYQTDYFWQLPIAIRAVCDTDGLSHSVAMFYHLVGDLETGQHRLEFALVPGEQQSRLVSDATHLFFQVGVMGEPERSVGRRPQPAAGHFHPSTFGATALPPHDFPEPEIPVTDEGHLDDYLALNEWPSLITAQWLADTVPPRRDRSGLRIAEDRNRYRPISGSYPLLVHDPMASPATDG